MTVGGCLAQLFPVRYSLVTDPDPGSQQRARKLGLANNDVQVVTC